MKNIPDDHFKTEFSFFCADIIREKGLDKVTVDDLVTEITPKARGKSPPPPPPPLKYHTVNHPAYIQLLFLIPQL
jgi:hypothetical protein